MVHEAEEYHYFIASAWGSGSSFFKDFQNVLGFPNISQDFQDFLIFNSLCFLGSKAPRVTIFTYPVERMTSELSNTTAATLYDGTFGGDLSKPGYWCLSVSYSIVFSSELLISINGNLIWSSEGSVHKT